MISLFKRGNGELTLDVSIKIIIILIFILFSLGSPLYPQIAINNTGSSPDSSAMLDIKSDNRGVLLPRMTFQQRNTIQNPAEGLIVYCSDCSPDGTGVISVFQGGKWKTMPLDCPVPAVPSAADAVSQIAQITWNWNSVPIARGYKWGTTNNITSAIDIGNTLTFTESSLSCWTTYTRYVWAYNDCGLSAPLSLVATTAQIQFSPSPGAGTHSANVNQIIWNWTPVTGALGYRWNTVSDFATATEMGTATTITENGMSCGTAYTRYVWAYNSCGYSAPGVLTFSTSNCWTCGNPLLITHIVDDVAPVSKTVSYGTVSGLPGETSKCWITSNLGSDHQATSSTDATEASAGWYWQFNRKQGYKHDGSARTPTSTWINAIDENLDWTVLNDPCAIELGNNWRLPTSTEWTNVDISGGWTNLDAAWNSLLKLHAAGRLYNGDGSLGVRGISGFYWSGNQGSSNYAYSISVMSSASSVNVYNKAMGYSVRCIRN